MPQYEGVRREGKEKRKKRGGKRGKERILGHTDFLSLLL
jgi:hypothetical protein